MAGKNTSTLAAARTAVTATGNDLLKLLADNGGSMMLTQAEGQAAIEAGHATVDTTKTEGDTALVTLTEAGQAQLAGSAPAPAASASSYEIEDNVAMPTTTTRRGREGGYPFDKLGIGQSFHVAKTADNPDPASRLASSVSGARVKYSEEIPGETEEVTVKTYKKGEDGKYLKDADGKRIVESETKETRPKMKLTRDFAVKSVGADDPKGEGARVWRVALS